MSDGLNLRKISPFSNRWDVSSFFLIPALRVRPWHFSTGQTMRHFFLACRSTAAVTNFTLPLSERPPYLRCWLQPTRSSSWKMKRDLKMSGTKDTPTHSRPGRATTEVFFKQCEREGFHLTSVSLLCGTACEVFSFAPRSFCCVCAFLFLFPLSRRLHAPLRRSRPMRASKYTACVIRWLLARGKVGEDAGFLFFFSFSLFLSSFSPPSSCARI